MCVSACCISLNDEASRCAFPVYPSLDLSDTEEDAKKSRVTEKLDGSWNPRGDAIKEDIIYLFFSQFNVLKF